MLGGDEAEQAALLCPGKGTEEEDGPGRKALNQSRGKEEEKKKHKKGRQRGKEKAKWISVEGSPRSRPTQGTGSPRAPDGEGDRAAAFLVRPLLHSWAHTKKGPEERSLRLGRFLVQTGRMQTQARPRDGGSSAPLAPPGSGRVLTCFPVPPLLLVRPRRWVGVLQQQEAGLRGYSAPSLNVAPVLGDVDAAAASCCHRCNRCPTPPTEGTARGRSAEVEVSLHFRAHFGSFRKGPSSRRACFGAPLRLRLLP